MAPARISSRRARQEIERHAEGCENEGELADLSEARGDEEAGAVRVAEQANESECGDRFAEDDDGNGGEDGAEVLGQHLGSRSMRPRRRTARRRHRAAEAIHWQHAGSKGFRSRSCRRRTRRARTRRRRASPRQSDAQRNRKAPDRNTTREIRYGRCNGRTRE